MKIGFVIQRYGSEVLGGSEQLCRLVAERLSSNHDIEVLTTCAQDYLTWSNVYPEGTDRIRGVTVRRFASARTRDMEAFNRYSDWIFNNPHTRADELEWLKQQGPWCPALIEYLRRNHQDYDVLVFFTYLYATTVLGLEVAPGRSVVVPTAHDEPAIRLEIFRDVFNHAAALCYLTDAERHFVQHHFPDRPLLEELIGVGVEIPQSTDPLEPTDEAAATLGPTPVPTTMTNRDDESTPERQYRWETPARGSVFRRRHRLQGPIVLYGGRIDPGKGCEELLTYFGQYVKEGGDATLVLMGAKLMSLPEETYVRFAGLLSETERAQALEAATVVVCPSPYESLSLLALEAMSVGTPVLVNGRSAVLVEHCTRSNAGLWYEDQHEFIECLNTLVGHTTLRASLGLNGRDYVRTHYRWDVVLGKYESILVKVRNAR